MESLKIPGVAKGRIGSIFRSLVIAAVFALVLVSIFTKIDSVKTYAADEEYQRMLQMLKWLVIAAIAYIPASALFTPLTDGEITIGQSGHWSLLTIRNRSLTGSSDVSTILFDEITQVTIEQSLFGLLFKTGVITIHVVKYSGTEKEDSEWTFHEVPDPYTVRQAILDNVPPRVSLNLYFKNSAED